MLFLLSVTKKRLFDPPWGTKRRLRLTYKIKALFNPEERHCLLHTNVTHPFYGAYVTTSKYFHFLVTPFFHYAACREHFR